MQEAMRSNRTLSSDATEDVMITIPSAPRSRPSLSLRHCARVAAAVAFVMLATAAVAQVRYGTPDEAVTALIDAAKASDLRALTRVLGPGSAEVVSSGDPVADASARNRVVEAYGAKHQVVMEGADKAVLILSAIQACLAYVDAQQEYAEKGVAGSGVYAQRIVSRPGKKDGLYWPAQSGADESPLGEFAASAAAEGYRAGQQRIPYHGYYYKVLTRQGTNAPGGALDYVVRDNMMGGFALVAYPAEYRNSGVMTFLVNHQGEVYEKDLGANSARIAAGMTAFDPDGTWQRVTDESRGDAK
jgi:hypothetical protein